LPTHAALAGRRDAPVVERTVPCRWRAGHVWRDSTVCLCILVRTHDLCAGYGRLKSCMMRFYGLHLLWASLTTFVCQLWQAQVDCVMEWNRFWKAAGTLIRLHLFWLSLTHSFSCAGYGMLKSRLNHCCGLTTAFPSSTRVRD
jgi:hypothetical protein